MRSLNRRQIIIGILGLLILLLVIWAIVNFIRNRRDERELILFGNVDVRQVEIGFRVSGKVNELCFEEGDFVEEGCLMAELDKSPFDSQLAEAEANLEAVQANFRNAEILLRRRRELLCIGGVSQEELDNAESSYYQLKASVAQAEAAVQVARDNLNYTEVYAPTDGIVLTRIREPGSVALQSEPVYTLSICSPVWIRAFVSEPQLGKIYFGMPAEIHTDTRGGTVYHGQIGFISPVSEFTPKTVETTELRTDLVYRLRIYADNPDRYLKQGMPVTVRIPLE